MEELDFEKSFDLLASHGIPVAPFKIVREKNEALAAAKKLGYPVVLKLASSQHKTDIGGVLTHVSSAEEVGVGFDRLKSLGKSIMVQKQVKGRELLLGIKRDSVFGPVITVGLGGTLTEVIKDASFRVCPLKSSEADEMLDGLRGTRLLQSFRGSPPVNRTALRRVIIALSKLAIEEPKISELDINPLMVNEKKAVAVDVRIIFS